MKSKITTQSFVLLVRMNRLDNNLTNLRECRISAVSKEKRKKQTSKKKIKKT